VTTLLLVRHGETDWNRELRIQGSSDTQLNATGRAQARDLARELAEVPLDAVYSSDLGRARETAEIVERFPDLTHHDGETDDEVRARVLAAVDRIVEAHPGEEVLVVSHGGALNALWHHAFGERIVRWGNCAAYRLAVRDGTFRAVD
jgi:broad specificity phosphatase PhoE